MRLIALALLSVACSAPVYTLTDHPVGPHRPDRFYLDPQAPLSLDPAFTPEEAEAIQEGLDGWSNASDGRVFHPIVPFGEAFLIQRADLDPGTYGRTRWTLGFQAVWLDPDRTGPAASRTAAHEVGHIMGLDHVDDPRCIMYTPNTDKLEFCQHDVDAICRLWGCP